MGKKTKEQIHTNMSHVKNSDTALENALCAELIRRGIKSFSRNARTIIGKPDIAFSARKIAIFCDGDFWHGYDWENSQNEIKSNRAFWIAKIEKNMARDAEVTAMLRANGWIVLRFWGHQIKKNLSECADAIEARLHEFPRQPYRTIDLCAGIGGIRKAFEMTGSFQNVVSAEIDKYACQTYEHLFGENPYNNLTSEDFKSQLEGISYDILLAGFPCQTFSRVGLEEGFENEEKGQIFFHIADIIGRSRPCAFFLENVGHLVTHDKGRTIKTILDTLVLDLNYHIIGVRIGEDGSLVYSPKEFVRNSREFGVPQNRPRTYIIGFDKERFPHSFFSKLPDTLPTQGTAVLYEDINAILDHNVPPKYYMASGYLDTLIKHRDRQEKRGYGFGYRVLNEEGIEHPIANTLLATGGSGRERNLVYDPIDGIAGMQIVGKKTPLNDKGIRVMTPEEWGKLQGFVNYAFIDENGIDRFSFPDSIPNVQKYKQFGNSVTIPAVKVMAEFMVKCLAILMPTESDKIVALAASKEYITKQEVVEILGSTKNHATYLLRNLVIKEKLELITHGRYSRYKLVQQINR